MKKGNIDRNESSWKIIEHVSAETKSKGLMSVAPRYNRVTNGQPVFHMHAQSQTNKNITHKYTKDTITLMHKLTNTKNIDTKTHKH